MAIHLARAAPLPLEIVIVDPRESLGSGLAHGGGHPDHRLNGPDAVHLLYPEGPDHFGDWLRSSGVLDRDPEAVTSYGPAFARRSDFGAYMAAQVAEHQTSNPSGSLIRHLRDRATALAREETGFVVDTTKGESFRAQMCVLATGHEPPTTPASLSPVTGHAGYIANPWDLAALARIDPAGDVLIVGTGLTTADVVAALVAQGHKGRITAISRRGLVPRPHSRAATSGTMWDRLAVDPPEFIRRHGSNGSLVCLLRVLRADMRRLEKNGETWHAAFDDLRDAVRAVWPGLPAVEKARFHRHLKPWYDVHRFRMPPQTEDIVDRSIDSGQLDYGAAKILGAAVTAAGLVVSLVDRGSSCRRELRVAAIVNCTGPSGRLAETKNPFLERLLSDKMARPGPIGLGLDIDEACRVIGADGIPVDDLYAVGPPTSASLGETLVVPFITHQAVGLVTRIVEQIQVRGGTGS